MAKYRVNRNTGYPAIANPPHAFGDVIEGGGPEFDAGVNAGYLEALDPAPATAHPFVSGVDVVSTPGTFVIPNVTHTIK